MNGKITSIAGTSVRVEASQVEEMAVTARWRQHCPDSASARTLPRIHGCGESPRGREWPRLSPIGGVEAARGITSVAGTPVHRRLRACGDARDECQGSYRTAHPWTISRRV